MPKLQCYVEHQPKFAQKWANKNANCSSHFAKPRFLKNPFVATPNFTKHVCFISFFER